MSASTWGNPNASKCVLLIHGLTNSSSSWHQIALEFASRCYYVFAPDLLGHGNARRGSDYSVTALAEELQPFLTPDHPYDIVIGHSIGAIVTCALLPLLKSDRSVRVVLIDPPLERTPEEIAPHKTFAYFLLEDAKSPEDFQATWPLSTKEDVVFRWLSSRLCDVTTIDDVPYQNVPWSFSHLLSTIPENVKVTVLAADPSKNACVKVGDLKEYPHVASKTVWDASHAIQMDAPQVVIDTALGVAEMQS